MEMINSLFAGLSSGPVFWALLAIVAILLVLAAFALFRSMRSGVFIAGGKGRRQRLAVVDATAVDNKRRLVLVRRDGVEHLILIGGHNDVVVESGIAVVSQTSGERQSRAAKIEAEEPVPPSAPEPAPRPERPPQARPETVRQPVPARPAQAAAEPPRAAMSPGQQAPSAPRQPQAPAPSHVVSAVQPPRAATPPVAATVVTRDPAPTPVRTPEPAPAAAFPEVSVRPEPEITAKSSEEMHVPEDFEIITPVGRSEPEQRREPAPRQEPEIMVRPPVMERTATPVRSDMVASIARPAAALATLPQEAGDVRREPRVAPIEPVADDIGMDAMSLDFMEEELALAFAKDAGTAESTQSQRPDTAHASTHEPETDPGLEEEMERLLSQLSATRT